MNEKPGNHAGERQRIKNILKTASAVLLASLVIAILLLPTITGIALKSHLKNNGYTEVSFGNIDLNLFRGDFALEEFNATADAARSIDISRLELDFSPVSLFKKIIKINRITIVSPHINLQQQADGSINAGYRAAPASSTETQNNAPKAQAPSNAENIQGWRIDLQELTIEDLRMKLENGDNSASFSSSFDFLLEKLLADAGGIVDIERIAMRNYRFLAQETPVVEYQEFSINRVRVNPSKLEIESINFNDLTVTVWRLAGGNLLSAATVSKFAAGKPATEEPASSQSTDSMQFSLGQISFSGNNRIRLKDESISPKLDTFFTIEELDIGALSSSDPELNTPVTFRMIRDKYDAISIIGTVAPLRESPRADLDILVKDFDITPFSPYLVTAIGYQAKTGLLNLENKLVVKDNLITGNNKIRMHRFTIEMGDPAKAGIFEDEINISLPMALYFIRDDDDNVNLEIPFNGKLDDPQFNIGPIIRQATGKALQGASLTYLSYALQPWGALYMIGRKIGDSDGGMQLEPIVFAAGDAVLNDNMRAYLAKLSRLLTKKEKLQLTICPISTADDTQFLRNNSQQPLTDGIPLQALDALSKQRAESVKSYFVDQQGIASDRLYKCAPRHETGKNSSPKVALSF